MKKGASAKKSRAFTLPEIWWWMLGLWLALLASTPFFLVDSLALIDVPDRGLLGEGAIWNPPLAVWFHESIGTEVPYWLATAVLACLLALTAKKQCSSDWPWIVVLVGVFALTQAEMRSTLATFLLVWLAGLMAQRAKSAGTAQESWQTLFMAVGIWVASLMSTLECGLVWAMLTLVVVMPALEQLRQKSSKLAPVVGFAVIWICLVAVPVLSLNGLGDACLRPVSWLWLRPPMELLPSMVPIWQMADFHWANWLFLLLLLESWRGALLGRVRVPDVLLLMTLTVTALGCARYSWIAVAAIFVGIQPGTKVPTEQGSSQPASRVERWRGHLLAALGALALVFQLLANGSTVLAADVIKRRLDIRQWNVSGTVMLTNLEQAATWQRASVRAGDVQYQYQPIVTDRWDAYHEEYPRYAAICEDWKNWKREAYLRQDGSWGGYQAVFDQWKPVFVIADSRDLAGIHRVSLDSHWKVIGIDPRKTVFAHSQSDATEQYVAYATQTLLTLEFPRPTSDVDFERVVAVGNSADAFRVSSVLTSLRLPYAALRVLPDSQDRQTQTCTTFAYAELAHRAHRYSGVHSLLDNMRTLGSGRMLTGERQVIEQTEIYLANLSKQLDKARATFAESVSPAEQTIREAIMHGQQPDIGGLKQTSEGSGTAQFYEALVGASEQPAHVVLQRLQAVPRNGLPARLAAECSFYIGCLGNELGDVGLTRNALTESLSGEAEFPFASIAEFYLSQIAQ